MSKRRSENFEEEALQYGRDPEEFAWKEDEEPEVDDGTETVVEYVDVSHEKCGLLCFKPDCLQRMNNMKMFLFVFMLTGLCQGITYSYMNVTVSTIEKRFQIPSKIMGVLLGVNDMSHLLTVLIVAHFLSSKNRPFWMGVGGITVGIAVLILATPELLAPPLSDLSDSNTTRSKNSDQICSKNSTSGESGTCDAANQLYSVSPLLLFTLGQLIFGVGTTVPIVLGVPFIDDNVKTKNSPLYFALAIAGRLLGPMLGVFLATACLTLYIDLSQSPNIRQDDPRWFGAWYLGYIIIGIACCATSWILFCFPAHPAVKKTIKIPVIPKPTFSGLFVNLKRLASNGTYLCLVLNDCLDLLVISGYISFSMKYTEYHFRETPGRVGKYSGFSNVVAFCGGSLLGGFIVKRFKFQPRHVAFLGMIAGICTTIGFFGLQAIKCEPRTMNGVQQLSGFLNVSNACSESCGCDLSSFSPVCHVETGMNYFSPCHAGCKITKTNNMTKYFYDCSCIPQSLEAPTVRRGYCETGCSSFLTFIIVGAASKFIAALSFAGGVMLSLRVVDVDLKPLSKGLQTLLTSTIAFIPGPIIMGAVIDSTCKVWGTTSCGEKGNCLIYDTDQLRIRMHLFTGIVKGCSALLYIFIYWKVRNLSFERPEAAVSNKKEEIKMLKRSDE